MTRPEFLPLMTGDDLRRIATYVDECNERISSGVLGEEFRCVYMAERNEVVTALKEDL